MHGKVNSVRRRIEFDAETWNALDRLAKDRMATIQELADEAFRDLLKKHRRPTTLQDVAPNELTTDEFQIYRRISAPSLL